MTRTSRWALTLMTTASLVIACRDATSVAPTSQERDGAAQSTSVDASSTAIDATLDGVDATNPVAVCIRRERDLPIDEAGGLAPKPLPRGVYWIQIDGRPPIELRADTGTSVPDLDLTQPHRVALFRGDQRVAAASMRFDSQHRCLGLANYSGSVALSDWDMKRCGCS